MADTNPLQRRMQTLDQATGNAFNSKKPDPEEQSQVRSFEFKKKADEPEDAPSGIKAPSGVQAGTGSSKLDALNAAKAKAKASAKKEPEVYPATE